MHLFSCTYCFYFVLLFLYLFIYLYSSCLFVCCIYCFIVSTYFIPILCKFGVPVLYTIPLFVLCAMLEQPLAEWFKFQISNFDLWLCVATWPRVVVATVLLAALLRTHIARTSVGRTDVLGSCCVACLWSARLPHVYRHMIIPPRPSLFLAFPSPAKLNAGVKRGRPGTEARQQSCENILICMISYTGMMFSPSYLYMFTLVTFLSPLPYCLHHALTLSCLPICHPHLTVALLAVLHKTDLLVEC